MIVKEREREEEEEEGVEQGERSRGPAIHRGSDACPRIAAIHSLPWGTLCVCVCEHLMAASDTVSVSG